MPSTTPASFEVFVAARAGALMKAALLLAGGDAGHAEDLLQTALERASRRWDKLDAPEAYLRTTMARLAVDRWRTHRGREVLVSAIEDVQALDNPLGRAEERQILIPALAVLASRQRVALVLRYFYDLSVEQTAIEMGCSTGSVKTHCSRGLTTLRQYLLDRNLTHDPNDNLQQVVDIANESGQP